MMKPHQRKRRLQYVKYFQVQESQHGEHHFLGQLGGD